MNFHFWNENDCQEKFSGPNGRQEWKSSVFQHAVPPCKRTIENGPRQPSHQLTYSDDEKGKFCHCYFRKYHIFLLLLPKSSMCLSASTSSISSGAKKARIFTHRGTLWTAVVVVQFKKGWDTWKIWGITMGPRVRHLDWAGSVQTSFSSVCLEIPSSINQSD